MNRRSLFVLLAVLALCGCRTAYYGTMEKLGVHKRDIMTDRVKDGRKSQQEAKQQFANALEQFRSVVKVAGGDLAATHSKLEAEYNRCKTGADNVHTHIEAIASVSQDLFKEWKAEISQYSSADLARRSQEQYDRSQALYAQMIAAMRKAELSMKPVLAVFKDQILFLKHNLNAQAMASLKGELTGLETQITGLIQNMEAGIREADAFLAGFGGK